MTNSYTDLTELQQFARENINYVKMNMNATMMSGEDDLANYVAPIQRQFTNGEVLTGVCSVVFYSDLKDFTAQELHDRFMEMAAGDAAEDLGMHEDEMRFEAHSVIYDFDGKSRYFGVMLYFPLPYMMSLDGVADTQELRDEITMSLIERLTGAVYADIN